MLPLLMQELGFLNNAFDLSDEEIDAMIDVNVRAPMYLVKRLS